MTPMSSTNPNNNLTRAEVEHLKRLEAIAQRGLHTDLELGNALAEISDALLYRATHQAFEAYLRDRWGIRRSPDYQVSHAAGLEDAPSSVPDPSPRPKEPEQRPVAPVRDEGPDLLASVWKQAHHVFGDDSVTAVEIRV